MPYDEPQRICEKPEGGHDEREPDVPHGIEIEQDFLLLNEPARRRSGENNERGVAP